MGQTALEHYLWLVSDEAEPWLTRTVQELAGQTPTPVQIRALRSSIGAERAALVLEQVELRVKARAKFSQADSLFFTRRGLEQATDEALAAYKSQRFTVAPVVADLCCGIGGDAMAIGQMSSVALVDRDPVSLLLAQANVERSGGHLLRAVAEDVTPQHLLDISAWHIDPDRRPTGKRTSRVEFGEPGVEVIDSLLATCPHAAIKLAPAAEVPEAWLMTSQREWIETRGECRQQVAWFGELAESLGSHTATLIDSSGDACSFSGEPGPVVDEADRLGKFVFDPSPSLVAAKLVGALADVFSLQQVSSHVLYLTGDEAVVHPHLQCFEVVADLPMDVRQLRAYVRDHKIGRLEIKKRGVDITPETLRPQLELAGDNMATLLVMRRANGVRAVVGQRTNPDDSLAEL